MILRYSKTSVLLLSFSLHHFRVSIIEIWLKLSEGMVIVLLVRENAWNMKKLVFSPNKINKSMLTYTQCDAQCAQCAQCDGTALLSGGIQGPCGACHALWAQVQKLQTLRVVLRVVLRVTWNETRFKDLQRSSKAQRNCNHDDWVLADNLAN